MKKTTAKIEHRDYVPHGWLAIKFCYVHFYGFRSEEMKKKWTGIALTRYDKYNRLCEQNKTTIQYLNNQINEINSHKKALIASKPSKPLFRFWYNKSEKEKICEINKNLDEISKQVSDLTIQVDNLEKENKRIEDKKYDVYEIHREIEDFLQQNGFVLTSTSATGNECITETEVWTLEE